MIFPRNERNVILYGRDLFQTFVAEYAVRVLKDRLDFIRFNQKKVCAELYKHVDEMMKNRAYEQGLQLGRKVILPSSITGSPRWEAEQFADTMAMLMELGRKCVNFNFNILRQTRFVYNYDMQSGMARD